MCMIKAKASSTKTSSVIFEEGCEEEEADANDEDELGISWDDEELSNTEEEELTAWRSLLLELVLLST